MPAAWTTAGRNPSGFRRLKIDDAIEDVAREAIEIGPANDLEMLPTVRIFQIEQTKRFRTTINFFFKKIRIL